MILWVLFDCLLMDSQNENEPNTDALTARIDVKNITIVNEVNLKFRNYSENSELSPIKFVL